MIKKAILLLILPYLVFIYLESCNKPCDHIETRNITGIDIKVESDTSINRNTLWLNLEYESYIVQNFNFNLTNKAYALTQVYDPCFNELINPIDSVSIVSNADFSSTHLANTEINNLFLVDEIQSYGMDRFRYDVRDFRTNDGIYEVEMRNSFSFRNFILPTLDSIHDLCVTVYCENGDVFKDSLLEVNLKSNL